MPSKLCGDAPHEEKLMRIFSSFSESLEAEDEEEEEESDESDDSDSDDDSGGGGGTGGRGWARLKKGGLNKSLGVETHDLRKRRERFESEAKMLAAICYQHGLYLPVTAINADQTLRFLNGK